MILLSITEARLGLKLLKWECCAFSHHISSNREGFHTRLLRSLSERVFTDTIARKGIQFHLFKSVQQRMLASGKVVRVATRVGSHRCGGKAKAVAVVGKGGSLFGMLAAHDDCSVSEKDCEVHAATTTEARLPKMAVPSDLNTRAAMKDG